MTRVGNETISLSDLADLDTILLEAREKLGRALLEDEPRVEADLYFFVASLMQEKVLPYVVLKESKAPCCSSGSHILTEGNYVLRYGLQELVSALLFLMPNNVGSETSHNTFTTNTNDIMNSLLSIMSNSSSSYYVSTEQRNLCVRMFFYVCWNPSIAFDNVIEALFPLLCTEEETAHNHWRTSENRICLNLFSNIRFCWMKRFVSDVLTGLIFTRKFGLLTSLKVFLLSDRTLNTLSISEVAEPLNSILCSDLTDVWTVTENQVARVPLSCINQIESLCSQLLQLCSLKADSDNMNDDFAQIVKETNFARSHQKVEDHLHEALVLLLNRLLYLPSQSSSRFKSFYKKYFYTNKFFLSPAFVPLSLKSVKCDANRVEHAVNILYTIVHGTQLGAASHTLCVVLEGVMPGLLNLMGISDRLPSTLLNTLRRIWSIIHAEQLCVEFVAEVAVRACFSTPCCTFAVTNRIETSISILSSPCSTATLLNGLSKCVLSWDSHFERNSYFQSQTIQSFIRHCQALIASHRECTTYILFLETFLSEAPSSAIFGPAASLQSTLDLCSSVTSISPYCALWAVIISKKLLTALVGTNLKSVSEGRCELLASIEKYERRLVLSSECDTDDVKAVLSLLEETRMLAIDGSTLNKVLQESDSLNTVKALFQSLVAYAEAGDVIRLSISSSELAATFERLSLLSGNDRTITAFRENCNTTFLVTTLVSILYTVADIFTAVSVVKALCWIGLYRWDSEDSSVLSDVLVDALLSSNVSFPVNFGVSASRSYVEEKLTVGKARLLDVVLSWCDYDEAGLTLRHLDECSIRRGKKSFFSILSLLTDRQQPDAVQVASLHLIGHYFTSVYPRVPISQLLHLSIGVFRHTLIELSKAACSSMLLTVVTFLLSNPALGLSVRSDEILEMKSIGTAMASYYSKPNQAHADGGNETPDETIRRHGQQIVELLLKVDPLII